MPTWYGGVVVLEERLDAEYQQLITLNDTTSVDFPRMGEQIRADLRLHSLREGKEFGTR